MSRWRQKPQENNFIRHFFISPAFREIVEQACALFCLRSQDWNCCAVLIWNFAIGAGFVSDVSCLTIFQNDGIALGGLLLELLKTTVESYITTWTIQPATNNVKLIELLPIFIVISMLSRWRLAVDRKHVPHRATSKHLCILSIFYACKDNFHRVGCIFPSKQLI